MPTIPEEIRKAAEHALLYGVGGVKMRTGLPTATWRKIYEGKPMKQPKPKRLTKDQQIANLQDEVAHWRREAERFEASVRQKSNQYDRACRDIEWLKDTLRQLIAAVKRGA